MNGLTLADDRIRFASTLMFYGVVMQQLIVISVITTGIAYSWMKMCLSVTRPFIPMRKGSWAVSR
ncbi:hypothetical protein AAIG39_14150 [Phytobacter palmae]|uniref:Uncharacterized protein n=1 Tax=Phytobacter palmae TaxID=1855371 RepID=A0ABU9V660_9ENTR